MTRLTMRLGALLTLRRMLEDGDTLNNVRKDDDGGILYESEDGFKRRISGQGDVYEESWHMVEHRDRFRS